MQNYFDNEATTSVHATMKPARSGKSFVTFSTYEDRQEALNRTTIMDDPTTYRAKGMRQSKLNAADNQSDQIRQEDVVNSQIPKPPPMLLSSHNNNNNVKPPNAPQKTTFNTQSQPYINENNVALRASNAGQANEMQFRNSNRNSTMAGGVSCNNNSVNSSVNNNRQTLRLGTVTIGEYRNHNTRREPEKFDFIAPTAKRNDSGATTPTNETLHSELHSTLSRSKLKKTNSAAALEHQRNCPLHQQQQQQNQQQQQHRTHHHHHHQQQQQHQQYDYQNVNFNSNNTFSVSEMTKKLQKTSLNGGNGGNGGGGGGVPSSTSSSSSAYGTANVGILKNGNRNSSSSSGSNKSTEKSIKFG